MNSVILMADIQESRTKPSRQLIRDFQALITLVNKKRKSFLLSPLTITLGDEFQGVLKSVKDAIETIVLLEENIIHQRFRFKLRYVLYVGPIDTKINRKTAHGMLGAGLTTARENLLLLKKEKDRFLLKTRNAKNDYRLNRAFLVYQNFIDLWKMSDYKIISEFLYMKDYKEIADTMNVNTSTAWRRRGSLKIPQYIALRELILSLP